MPQWVTTGFNEYAKRMPKSCALKLIELPMPTRSKTGSVAQYKAIEAKRIMHVMPKQARLIVLDEHAPQVTTKGLALKLEDWLAGGHDVALVVGGPDGLEQSVLQQSQWQWGLSKLTLPHPMVRILVAEQLYRAWSVINQHPYHRE